MSTKRAWIRDRSEAKFRRCEELNGKKSLTSQMLDLNGST